MPLNIKDPEAYSLARELSRRTGQSLTTVVRESLRARLDRERSAGNEARLIERVRAITREIAALPVLDPRSADEIVGYDEHGVPR